MALFQASTPQLFTICVEKKLESRDWEQGYAMHCRHNVCINTASLSFSSSKAR